MSAEVLPRRPRVAVALGGGGARGYAHIGILDVLDERGYDVVSVAGCSMGAVVGGLYAAGGLDAYADWVRGLTHREVLRLYDISPRAPGAIRAERIFARVSAILGDTRIEDLPIPFTAVATDLETAEECWLQEGPLTPALRASAALPGFMTPVVVDGRLLADGGLTNPVPVAPTVDAAADLTVAVVVAGRSRPSPPRLHLRHVMDMSIEAVWTSAVRHSLAAHPPDVLITVPRACRMLDFHKAGELIAVGRRLAEDALDRTAQQTGSLAFR